MDTFQVRRSRGVTPKTTKDPKGIPNTPTTENSENPSDLETSFSTVETTDSESSLVATQENDATTKQEKRHKIQKEKTQVQQKSPIKSSRKRNKDSKAKKKNSKAKTTPTNFLKAAQEVSALRPVQMDPEEKPPAPLKTIDGPKWPKAFYCTLNPKMILRDPVVAPDGCTYEQSAAILLTPEHQAVDKSNPTSQDSYKSESQDPGGQDPSSDSTSADEPTPRHYPNRALKAIMEEIMALRGDSFQSSLHRMQFCVAQGLTEIIQATSRNNTSKAGVDVDGNETTAGSAKEKQRASIGETLASFVRPNLYEALYCPITFNLIHDPVIDCEGNTYERVAIEHWIRSNGQSPITRTPMTLQSLYPNRAIRQFLEEEAQRFPDDELHPIIRQWKEESCDATHLDVEWGEVLVGNNAESSPSTSAAPSQYPTIPSVWEIYRAIFQTMLFMFASIFLVGFILGYQGFLFLFLFALVSLLIYSRRQNQQLFQ